MCVSLSLSLSDFGMRKTNPNTTPPALPLKTETGNVVRDVKRRDKIGMKSESGSYFIDVSSSKNLLGEALNPNYGFSQDVFPKLNLEPVQKDSSRGKEEG